MSAAPAADTGYTVQGGDTLSGIALHQYGHAGAWTCIWHANLWIANPNWVLAGWTITLPTSCGGMGGSYSGGRYHTVTSAETLSGIACYYYYDCNYWRIYNANRWALWNPNFVMAGTVLYIP